MSSSASPHPSRRTTRPPRGLGQLGERLRAAVLPTRRRLFPEPQPGDPTTTAADAATTHDSTARHALEPATMSAADVPGTFVGVLSPDGVLLDGLPAPAAGTDWLATDAVGTPLWEAPWWAWSPDVQERLRTAVRRAAAGEMVSYGDTVRVGGNMLVTVGLTVAPVVSPDGVTSVRCSVLDPGDPGGAGAPRHLSAPPADG